MADPYVSFPGATNHFTTPYTPFTIGDELEWSIRFRKSKGIASQESIWGLGAQGGGSPSGLGLVQLAGSDDLRCYFASAAGLAYTTIPASQWSGDTLFTLKWTYDATQAAEQDRPKVYIDGVFLNTTTTNPTNWPPVEPNDDVVMGAEGRAAFDMSGDAEWFEYRDSIDGTVLYRWDAADIGAVI